MTEPAVETCRRGHPRTPENTVVRQHTSGPKERTIRQCRVCARLAAARRSSAASQETPPSGAVTDAD